MVLSCVPAVSVWADETSGSCGDSAEWVLSDDGVLKITGEGKISNGGWDVDSVISVVIDDVEERHWIQFN